MDSLMRGVYRDAVFDAFGGRIADTGWRNNTIVESAWPLIAGLLKNDPVVRGILFWAVGTGRAEWDASPPAVDTAATRLMDEVDRVAVSPETIRYIGADGDPVETPAACIEAGAAFTWNRDRTLREFGLFGGDATEAAGSGTLINYVIHPRVDIPAGRALTRRLRFTLASDAGIRWHSIPPHWLAEVSAERIDGVGEVSAEILNRAGVSTIGDLARVEPMEMGSDLDLMRVVELRSKARLALRTAAGLKPVAGLNDRTAWEVLSTPVNDLIAQARGASEAVLRLTEQVGALQLTLDNRYLRQVTVGRLAQRA